MAKLLAAGYSLHFLLRHEWLSYGASWKNLPPPISLIVSGTKVSDKPSIVNKDLISLMLFVTKIMKSN